jgi:hypothetical protein
LMTLILSLPKDEVARSRNLMVRQAHHEDPGIAHITWRHSVCKGCDDDGTRFAPCLEIRLSFRGDRMN